MKIRIDIDCTPQEARNFLGLPDLEPMQKALLRELEERMRASLGTMDPERMIELWFPAGVEGWEQMQKLFWSRLSGAAGSGRKGK